MANQKKLDQGAKPGPGPGGPGGGPRGGYSRPKNLGRTLLRMFSYLARRPILLVLVVVFVVCASLSNVAATYMLRPIINSLEAAVTAGQNTLPTLLSSCLGLMGLYVLAAACTYGQANLMAQLAQKGCNAMRRDLFDKLQELPLSYFDRHTHGELMSRFTNDADNVQLALEQSVIQLVSSVLSFAATVVMMIVISPPLFLISAVMLAVVLLVFKKLGNLSRIYYGRQQAALGAVNGNIQEMIEGMKVIKAFTHEEEAKAQFAALNEEYRVSASRASFYASCVMPITANITNVGYALVAAAGGALAILQGFDIGGLGSYLTYNRQLTMPINQISMQLTVVLSALAGAERIFEVMDAQPEEDDGKVELVPAYRDEDGVIHEYTGQGRPGVWAWRCPQGPETRLFQDAQGVWNWRITRDGRVVEKPVWGPVYGTGDDAYVLVEIKGDVRLEHVDFSYVPDKPVLKDVSVYAKPGQKIAFVGSTGAGKTTIISLINRFYDVTEGSITFDGIDVRDIRKDDLRRSLGMVLQDTHLFTGTVADNIRFGRLDATDREVEEAARIANADSFIRRLPQGYDTPVTGDGANLSQGQRQLLAIARAAVADPPVRILDAATSSIDTRTEALIEQGMDRLMEGRTVFVIAHRLSTVRNANAILVMEQGRVVERGDHQELLDQRGVYYQLYNGMFELS